MKNLLLTLGHNSSAIMIEDNQIRWGYETERVTGVKSDSRFPRAVLDKFLTSKPDMAYVTHWSPDGQLSSMGAKYWDPAYLEDVPIRTLSASTTHHDTHIYGAIAFAGQEFVDRPRCYGLVIDGFGTFGEHFSVYRFENGRPVLVRRVHGYDTSLGLWYQYATAFMGMKMHEDEYKLLGYEVHIDPDTARRLDSLARAKAEDWVQSMRKSVYGSAYDPVYDVQALPHVRESIYRHLNEVCDMFGLLNPTTFESRVVLAYYVQAVLEITVLNVLQTFPVEHLLCSGGVFYNVKLNKRIVDYVKGQTCVYPLAGDQGNALGLYYADHPEFVFPKNLNWGLRNLVSKGLVEGLYVVETNLEAIHLIFDRLNSVGYVNLVRGSMEFGPRAMCNTSTLAVPTKAVVERINAANDRNTVMPMAPVLTRQMYSDYFHNTDKVHRSERCMIVALEYFEHVLNAKNAGITHEYHWPSRIATGRPQVIDDNDFLMQAVLNYVGTPLINTSFNFHGHPIAFDMESVIDNHRLQRQRDPSFETIVLETQ